jgi:hypothetical protein
VGLHGVHIDSGWRRHIFSRCTVGKASRQTLPTLHGGPTSLNCETACPKKSARLSLPRPSIVQAPQAFANEWLVTNGLGGYASGTVSHANTRRYHGLLVASLHPPVERVVMVSKADLTVRYRRREFQLGCNEFADGTIAPRGFELLTSFELEDGVPVWTYSLSDAVLEQRIWMSERRTHRVVASRRRGACPKHFARGTD